jgi:hypothetical protein
MNMLYGLLYIALVAALFFVGLCVLITAIAFVRQPPQYWSPDRFSRPSLHSAHSVVKLGTHWRPIELLLRGT